MNPVRPVLQFFRRQGLRRSGVRVPTDATLGRGLACRLGWADGHHGQIVLGPRLTTQDGVVLDAYAGRIEIGSDGFLGPYVVIYGHGGVTIGADCLISMHCRILSSNHAVPPLGTIIRSQPDELRPTSIGRDVWLGAGVTVMGGVTIGDGCIVGAGAVVTKDLSPGSIAYGVPAVVRGQRPAA